MIFQEFSPSFSRLRHAVLLHHYPHHSPISISAWVCTDLFTLGDFAKLRKATISFVTSARPTIRMAGRSPHRTDFHVILIFE